MECKWGRTNCKNINSSCDLCLIEDHFYSPVVAPWEKQKKRAINKQDNRMGSKFEYQNHKNNEALVSTDMTINSGATAKEKGDEQIRGIIRIMEELKTQDPHRARGHNQFTIQRKWLDKLDREAPIENMEFWYLKFAFCDTDDNSYIVFDTKQMDSMIATIVHDRKIAKEAEAKIKVADARRQLAEAEATKFYAETEYLKALLEEAGIKYDDKSRGESTTNK